MNEPMFLKAWTLHGMQRKIAKACQNYEVISVDWSFVPGRDGHGGDFYGTVLIHNDNER